MEKKPKIVIGLPCTDQMMSDTAHAIGCEIIGNKNVIDFFMRKSCDIVSSRTWIVQQAIEKGATHLFFVDSDICFPMGTIDRMLSHNKSIVAANYHKRRFPLEDTSQPAEGTEKSETELYEAKYAATGCMLIDLSIFKGENAIDGSFFNFGRDKNGMLVLGEDAWFCLTARDKGHKTYVDPTIKVQHLGYYKY